MIFFYKQHHPPFLVSLILEQGQRQQNTKRLQRNMFHQYETNSSHMTLNKLSLCNIL